MMHLIKLNGVVFTVSLAISMEEVNTVIKMLEYLYGLDYTEEKMAITIQISVTESESNN